MISLSLGKRFVKQIGLMIKAYTNQLRWDRSTVLPSGWVECTSRVTNHDRVYCLNKSTNQSQWDRPTVPAKSQDRQLS